METEDVRPEGTKERIEACALKEFLDKGFHGASLRQIVKEAGVTTGAFYKYYPTKEALFEGLVGSCVTHVYRMFDENYEAFTKQGLSDQTKNMRGNTGKLMKEFIDYVYEHLDVFRLVLTASEGTAYSDFLHNLALREEKSTFLFAELMRENGLEVPKLDEEFVHMVSSGLFGGIFEIVLHNMDRQKAYERIRLLRDFYTAGWEKILGIDFAAGTMPE